MAAGIRYRDEGAAHIAGGSFNHGENLLRQYATILKVFGGRDDARQWLWPLIAGGIFSAFVSFKGIPALRHDWSWDAGGTFFSNAWSSLGGWETVGIGTARPYPVDYLLALFNLVVIRFLGHALAFPLEMLCIGFACAFGAVRLAWRISGVRAIFPAAALFAVFNPWVYNKVVAGHIFMILAYGAVMLVVSELMQPEPSARRAGFYALLTLQSLQFFLPLFVAVALWARLRRERLAVPALMLLAALPVFFGILLDRFSLLNIPYMTSWQSVASVSPLAALTLTGYYSGYANVLIGANIDDWIVVACAFTGAIIGLRSHFRYAGLAIACFLGAWALCAGTKGTFGSAYLWLVTHVPETGLYRELYDVVGFLAIGLIAGSACASRVIPVRVAWTVASIALLVAWLWAPPSQYWVAFSSLPHALVTAATNTRYALLPALQPLAFHGQGSGLDPDAVARANNVTALNTPQLSFPESPALIAFERFGDTRWLSALSVSEVIVRPYFKTLVGTLETQVALPLRSERSSRDPGLHELASYEPELSLQPLPPLERYPAYPWESSIFFGDASGLRGAGIPTQWADAAPVEILHAPTKAVAAATGWVDVRSAFVDEPSLSQGLGGTITTSVREPLLINPQLWTLVNVTGALMNQDGIVIARDTEGYRWIAPGNVSLRCSGLCVAVAQSARPAPHHAFAQARPVPLAFRQVFSWLAVASVPPGSAALLRYNVRYDAHWIALIATKVLPHVAVDSTFNGWAVAPQTSVEGVFIVEWVAAIQEVLIVLCSLAIVVLGIRWGYEEFRGRGTSN